MAKNEDLEYYKNLGKFEDEQINEIAQGLEEDLEVSYYAKPEFDCFKMRQIRYGLESGVKVSTYAKPEFSVKQMWEIRLGLEDELNVSYYAKPEFSEGQMREIRKGLEKGLDFSLYAKEEFDEFQMYQIRWGLEKGVDASIYAKPEFSAKEMLKIRDLLEEIRDQLEDKLKEKKEISEYITNDYDKLKTMKTKEEMEKMERFLFKYAYDWYNARAEYDAEKNYNEDQVIYEFYSNDLSDGNIAWMSEEIKNDPFDEEIKESIIEGLSTKQKNELNVNEAFYYCLKPFSKTILNFYFETYKETINNLIDYDRKTDNKKLEYYEKIANYFQGEEEFDLIKEGLEQGLDVQLYANTELIAEEMEEIKKELINKKKKDKDKDKGRGR